MNVEKFVYVIFKKVDIGEFIILKVCVNSVI